MALKQDGVHVVLNLVPRVISYPSLPSERERERERERARSIGTFVTLRWHLCILFGTFATMWHLCILALM